MKNRLLVISFDAMVREDVEYMKTLPSFTKYFSGNFSEVKTIRTIYPTITYPAHVSIVTGCYADTHGVLNNYPFHVTEGETPWLWDHSVVKVSDIFTYAKQNGFRTASVFWPVTGNHHDIDDLIDEYWMKEGETLDDGFRSMGSNDAMIALLERHKEMLPPSYVLGGKKNVIQQPNTDKFITAIACDILKERNDEVVFIHLSYMDYIRHHTGVFNPDVTTGVELEDNCLGLLMKALEESGHFDETNIILLSDHGQMNIVRAMNINVFLRDKGFIDVNEAGNIINWRAFCLSNSMSSLVYVKNKEDEIEVGKLLRSMANEGIYGFTGIMDREEAEEKEHLAGGFSFVLETDGYSSLLSGVNRPIVRPLDNADFRLGRATHGYLPDKGPQPFFLAMGPKIKKGITLERRPIVDEAPTFAEILGFDMPSAQGTAMKELLR